ncbi:hypothetical protein [Nocardia sp. NBC_01009]|uniref:hypothetical protein n=1 Tax=Nocardia sp. NBC_01009 TaxID=2975996 RepID=UPI0038643F09|nr:hypothetical protein OHA42_05705 [Nocardia sp. NBC_01009]
MAEQLLPGVPPDVQIAMFGYVPDAKIEGMRRAADAWSDSANRLAGVLHGIEASQQRAVAAAANGFTAEAIRKQYSELAEGTRRLMKYSDSMAEQLYEAATEFELEKYMVIGIASVLAAQLTWDLAMGFAGVAPAAAHRAAAGAAMSVAWRDLMVAMAVRGAVIGGLMMGGVRAVAEGIQVAHGDREAVDWKAVRIAATAGAVGGGFGGAVGSVVAPAVSRLGANAVSKTAQNGWRVAAVVAAGVSGGAVGGLTGGLTAGYLTGNYGNLADMVLMGVGGGLVGGLGAGYRSVRTAGYTGASATGDSRNRAVSDLGGIEHTPSHAREPVTGADEGQVARADGLTPEMMAAGKEAEAVVVRDLTPENIANMKPREARAAGEFMKNRAEAPGARRFEPIDKATLPQKAEAEARAALDRLNLGEIRLPPDAPGRPPSRGTPPAVLGHSNIHPPQITSPHPPPPAGGAQPSPGARNATATVFAPAEGGLGRPTASTGQVSAPEAAVRTGQDTPGPGAVADAPANQRRVAEAALPETGTRVENEGRVAGSPDEASGVSTADKIAAPAGEPAPTAESTSAQDNSVSQRGHDDPGTADRAHGDSPPAGDGGGEFVAAHEVGAGQRNCGEEAVSATKKATGYEGGDPAPTGDRPIGSKGMSGDEYARRLGADWRKGGFDSPEALFEHVRRNGGTVAAGVQFKDAGAHAFVVSKNNHGEVVIRERVGDVVREITRTGVREWNVDAQGRQVGAERIREIAGADARWLKSLSPHVESTHGIVFKLVEGSESPLQRPESPLQPGQAPKGHGPQDAMGHGPTGGADILERPSVAAAGDERILADLEFQAAFDRELAQLLGEGTPDATPSASPRATPDAKNHTSQVTPTIAPDATPRSPDVGANSPAPQANTPQLVPEAAPPRPATDAKTHGAQTAPPQVPEARPATPPHTTTDAIDAAPQAATPEVPNTAPATPPHDSNTVAPQATASTADHTTPGALDTNSAAAPAASPRTAPDLTPIDSISDPTSPIGPTASPKSALAASPPQHPLTEVNNIAAQANQPKPHSDPIPSTLLPPTPTNSAAPLLISPNAVPDAGLPAVDLVGHPDVTHTRTDPTQPLGTMPGRPGLDGDQRPSDPEEVPRIKPTYVPDPRPDHFQDPHKRNVGDVPDELPIDHERPEPGYITLPGVSGAPEKEHPRDIEPLIPKPVADPPGHLPATTSRRNTSPFTDPDESDDRDTGVSHSADPEPPPEITHSTPFTDRISDHLSADPATRTHESSPPHYSPRPNTLIPGGPQDPKTRPGFHPDDLGYNRDISGIPQIGGLPPRQLAKPGKPVEQRRPTPWATATMGDEPDRRKKRRPANESAPPPPDPVNPPAPALAPAASESTEAKIERLHGIPIHRQQAIQEYANKHNLIITVRPTNPDAVARINAGLPAKPELVKSKSINDKDVELGAKPGSQGLVGYFVFPESASEPGELRLPPRDGVSEEHWNQLVKRLDERRAEYAALRASMDKHIDKGRFVVREGIVHGRNDAGEFLPLTGDHDLFDIRHAGGSRLSPLENFQHFDQAHLADMGVQHPPLAYWNPTSQADWDMYIGLMSQHGANGVPLVQFRPDQDPVLTQVTPAERAEIAKDRAVVLKQALNDTEVRLDQLIRGQNESLDQVRELLDQARDINQMIAWNSTELSPAPDQTLDTGDSTVESNTRQQDLSADSAPDPWLVDTPDPAAGLVNEVLGRTDVGREALAALRDLGWSVRFEDRGGTGDRFNPRTMAAVVDTHERGQLSQASSVVRIAALAEAVRAGHVEVQPTRIRDIPRAEYVESHRRAEAAAVGKLAEFHLELEQQHYILPGIEDTALPGTGDTATRFARQLESDYRNAYNAAVQSELNERPGTDSEQLHSVGQEAAVAVLFSNEIFDGNRDNYGREWDHWRESKTPAGMQEYRPVSAEAARQLDRLVRERAAAQRELARIERDWNRLVLRAEGRLPEHIPADRRVVFTEVKNRSENGRTNAFNMTLLQNITTQCITAREKLYSIERAITKAVWHDPIDSEIRDTRGRWINNSIALLGHDSQQMVVLDTNGDLATNVRLANDRKKLPKAVLSDGFPTHRVGVRIDGAGAVFTIREPVILPEELAKEQALPEWGSPTVWLLGDGTQKLTEITDYKLSLIYHRLSSNSIGLRTSEILQQYGIHIRFNGDPSSETWRDNEYRQQNLSSASGYDSTTNAVVLQDSQSVDDWAHAVVQAASLAEQQNTAAEGQLERLALYRKEYIDLMVGRQALAFARSSEFVLIDNRERDLSYGLGETPVVVYSKAFSKARKIAKNAYQDDRGITENMIDAAAHQAGTRALRERLLEVGPRIDGRDYAAHYGAEWDRAHGIPVSGNEAQPAKRRTPAATAQRRDQYIGQVESLRALRNPRQFVPISPAERSYDDAYDKAYRKAARAKARSGSVGPEQAGVEAGRRAVRKYFDKVGSETAEITLDVARHAHDNTVSYQPWPKHEATVPTIEVRPLSQADAVDRAREAIEAVLHDQPGGQQLTARIAEYPGLPMCLPRLVVAAAEGQHMDALSELSDARPEFVHVLWNGTHQIEYLMVGPGSDGRTDTRPVEPSIAEGPYRHPNVYEAVGHLLAEWIRYRTRTENAIHIGFDTWLRQLGPGSFYAASDPTVRPVGSLRYDFVSDRRKTVEDDALVPEPHPIAVVHQLLTRLVPLPTPLPSAPGTLQQPSTKFTMARVETPVWPFWIRVHTDGTGKWRIEEPTGADIGADALARQFHDLTSTNPDEIANQISRLLLDGSADLNERSTPISRPAKGGRLRPFRRRGGGNPGIGDPGVVSYHDPNPFPDVFGRPARRRIGGPVGGRSKRDPFTVYHHDPDGDGQDYDGQDYGKPAAAKVGVGDIERQYGIPVHRQQTIQEYANTHDLIITVCPTNPDAAVLIKAGIPGEDNVHIRDGGEFMTPTGDRDLFDIRHADGSRLPPSEIPQYFDQTQLANAGVQHPPLAYWNPTSQADWDMYITLMNQHGPNGVPLVQFRPNQDPVLTQVTPAQRAEIAKDRAEVLAQALRETEAQLDQLVRDRTESLHEAPQLLNQIQDINQMIAWNHSEVPSTSNRILNADDPAPVSGQPPDYAPEGPACEPWIIHLPDPAASAVEEVLARTKVGGETLTELRDARVAVRYENRGGEGDFFNARTMEAVIDTYLRNQLEQASSVVRIAAFVQAVRAGEVEVQPVRIRNMDRAAYVESLRHVEAAAVGRQAEFNLELEQQQYILTGAQEMDTLVAKRLESDYRDSYNSAKQAELAENPAADHPYLRKIGQAAGISAVLSSELFDGNRHSHGREWDRRQNTSVPAGMEEFVPSTTRSARKLDQLVRARAAVQRTLEELESDWECTKRPNSYSNLGSLSNPSDRKQALESAERNRHTDARQGEFYFDVMLQGVMIEQYTRALEELSRINKAITGIVQRHPIEINDGVVFIASQPASLEEQATDESLPAPSDDVLLAPDSETPTPLAHDLRELTYAMWNTVIESQIEKGNDIARRAMEIISLLGVSVRIGEDPRINTLNNNNRGRFADYDHASNAVAFKHYGYGEVYAVELVRAASMAEQLHTASNGPLERLTLHRDDYVDLMVKRHSLAFARSFEFNLWNVDIDARRLRHLRDQHEPLEMAYNEAFFRANKVAIRAYGYTSGTTEDMYRAAAHQAGVRAVSAQFIELGPRIDGLDYASFYRAEWDRAHGFPPVGNEAPPTRPKETPAARKERGRLYVSAVESVRQSRNARQFVPPSPAEIAYKKAYEKAYQKAERAKPRPDAIEPEQAGIEAGRKAVLEYFEKVGPETAEITLDVARHAHDNTISYQPWPRPDTAATTVNVPQPTAPPVAGMPQLSEKDAIDWSRKAIEDELCIRSGGQQLTPQIAEYPGLVPTRPRRLVVAAARDHHMDALSELINARPEFTNVLWNGTHRIEYLLVEPGPDGSPVTLPASPYTAEGPYRHPNDDEAVGHLLAEWIRFSTRKENPLRLGFDVWLRQLGPDSFIAADDPSGLPEGRLRPDFVAYRRTTIEADALVSEPHPIAVVHRLLTRLVRLPPAWTASSHHWQSREFSGVLVETPAWTFSIKVHTDGGGLWRIVEPTGTNIAADALARQFHDLTSTNPDEIANQISRLLLDGSADLNNRSTPIDSPAKKSRLRPFRRRGGGNPGIGDPGVVSYHDPNPFPDVFGRRRIGGQVGGRSKRDPFTVYHHDPDGDGQEYDPTPKPGAPAETTPPQRNQDRVSATDEYRRADARVNKVRAALDAARARAGEPPAARQMDLLAGIDVDLLRAVRVEVAAECDVAVVEPATATPEDLARYQKLRHMVDALEELSAAHSAFLTGEQLNITGEEVKQLVHLFHGQAHLSQILRRIAADARQEQFVRMVREQAGLPPDREHGQEDLRLARPQEMRQWIAMDSLRLGLPLQASDYSITDPGSTPNQVRTEPTSDLAALLADIHRSGIEARLVVGGGHMYRPAEPGEVFANIKQAVHPDVITDVRDMPVIPDGAFDSVYLERFSLTDVVGLPGAMADVHRVLKPGGELLITPSIEAISSADDRLHTIRRLEESGFEQIEFRIGKKSLFTEEQRGDWFEITASKPSAPPPNMPPVVPENAQRGDPPQSESAPKTPWTNPHSSTGKQRHPASEIRSKPRTPWGPAKGPRGAGARGGRVTNAPATHDEFCAALDTELSSGMPAPTQVLADATSQQMTDALLELTTNQFEVLWNLQQGFSIAEIAQDMDSTPDAVTTLANDAVHSVVTFLTRSAPLARALAEATPWHIQSAFRQLTPEERRVVDSMFRYGRSVPYMATRMQLSEPEVKFLAHHAVQTIANFIAQKRGLVEVDPTADTRSTITIIHTEMLTAVLRRLEDPSRPALSATAAELHSLSGRFAPLAGAGSLSEIRPHQGVRSGNSLYLGTVHNTIIKNPHSAALIEELKDWFAKIHELYPANKDKVIAFTEGGRREIEDTLEKAFSRHGEMGVITFLAAKYGIEIRSLEEDVRDQVAAIIQGGHSPEAVFLYYCMRRGPQEYRRQHAVRKVRDFDRAEHDFPAEYDGHMRETAEMYAWILREYTDLEFTDPYSEFLRLAKLEYPLRPSTGRYGLTEERWLLYETVYFNGGPPATSRVQSVAGACHVRRQSATAQKVDAAVASEMTVIAAFGEPHFPHVVRMMSNFADGDVYEIQPEMPMPKKGAASLGLPADK